MRALPLFLLTSIALMCGCGEAPPAIEVSDTIAKEVYTKLQEQLIMAEPGDVVDIPEGTFEFDRPLS
ncbi:MAG: hypothetical protein GVY26_15815, partial [Bacteroidetes bacterium]|nr:hypothetical protein [Bacteroidota bacterium]